MQLTEARAIVTGAAGGLGSCFALELARAGARVLAGDTNAAGLRELAGRGEGLAGESLARAGETGFLDGISEQSLERLTAAIPLGRRGAAEEIWQAVRFILECDFFTGRTVEVDGGAAMGGPV